MRFIVGPSSPDFRHHLDAVVRIADEDPDIEILEQRRASDVLELVVLDMPEQKAKQLKDRFPSLLVEEDAPLEPFEPRPAPDRDSTEG